MVPTRPDEHELLTLLVSSVRDYAIFILDPKGYVRTWNPGAQRIKGWTSDEIIGQHFSVFYPEPDRAWLPPMELTEAATHGRFEDEGWRLRKDGNRFWANVVITALRDPAGELVGFAKVTRDLSERRRAEEQLAESARRLREAQMIGRMGDFLLDLDTGHVSWSEGLARVFGREQEELPDTLDGFLALVHPEDREATRAALDNAIASRGTFDFEARIEHPDASIRTLQTRGTAQPDETGRIHRLAGIAIDVTERKEAEVKELELAREQAAREQAEQQAQEFEQMLEELAITNEQLALRTDESERTRAEAERASRAKSQFLANMSHELRTPLNAIAGYTDLLELEVHGPISDMQRDALRRIQRNQRHLLSLINDLLNFSKLTAGRVQYALAPVDVSELFDDVESLIGIQVQRKELDFRVEPPEQPLTVRADPEKLVQILLNLLTNAVKFTDRGGRVRLSAQRRDGSVTVEVEDTGRGIPADRLDAIFDPFIQVHGEDSQGGGAGLGLAIARELARGMRGDLTVESQLGAGSTFRLLLPAATPERRR